jgi:hypothetical protein
MSLSASLSAPPDPRWNHVIVATAMSAGQAAGFDVSALGELSLAMSDALADLDELAGVESVRCEIHSRPGRVDLEVSGHGEEIADAPAHPWTARLGHRGVNASGQITYRISFPAG